MRRGEAVQAWREYLCSVARVLETFAEELEEVETEAEFARAYDALLESECADLIDIEVVSVRGVDIGVLQDILTLEERCALCGDPVEAFQDATGWVWRCTGCGRSDPPLGE